LQKEKIIMTYYTPKEVFLSRYLSLKKEIYQERIKEGDSKIYYKQIFSTIFFALSSRNLKP